MEHIRLTKLMAARGLCSRREAETMMARGWVSVDGEVIVEPGTRVREDAQITLAPQARADQAHRVTVLLHKPIGFVSGQPEKGYAAAVTLILPENQFSPSPDMPWHAGHLIGLAPAGRLDIDSHGLLVLTQDGRIARQLVGADFSVEKEYLVRVKGRVTDSALRLLNHGLSLDGRTLKPAKVSLLAPDYLQFILREGRKRQIRRMCALVNLEVTRLKRVRIGNVTLGNLPYGKWRYLRADETF